MNNEEIREYSRQHFQELYELLLELAQIPAPTGDESRRAAFCCGWLRSQGLKESYMDEAGNVVWPYRVREGCPVLVFMAHMDVVFSDTERLPLYERDGKIFCPGIGDNSANVTSLLMAARYVSENQPDTGETGLLFVFSVGEEGLGNLKGSSWICRNYGSRIREFYAFDLTLDSYTSKAVGSLRYRVSVRTGGGHSFGCFGNTNANVVLAELITELYRLETSGRGHTTYNVGMISGGTSVNTIAQEASMLYEIRSVDRQELEQMRQKFARIVEIFQKRYAYGRRSACIGASIHVEKLGERPCEGNVDEHTRSRMFAQTERAVETAAGKKPVPDPCSTDCNIPLSMGIPSVCVGLCRGAGAHTREEYIEKASLGPGLEAALLLLEAVAENERLAASIVCR